MSNLKKKIKNVLERAVASPVTILFLVFVLAAFSVIFITTKYFNFSDPEFRRNLLSEAYGVLLEIVIFGILILWLKKRGAKQFEIRRYEDEIDDLRDWHTEEAARRIRGNIVRLNNHGISRIDLHKCFLKRMHLWKADLQGATLDEANLERAKLHGANLEDAISYEADLEEATLRGANLKGAKLHDVI